MSASVIVPHFGCEMLLIDCLGALRGYAPDAEQIIVDGNEQNDGFAGNCNRGARDASGDVLVFLNNDCTIHAGWLEPLVDALGRYPVAGSLLLYPDGRIQHAGVNVLRTPDGTLEGRNTTVARPSGEVTAVTGASLAVRADTFWAVGGFDTGYWNGYEDLDLCFKVHEYTGRRCWFAADSVATHLESASGPERWTHVAENIDRLQTKWGD